MSEWMTEARLREIEKRAGRAAERASKAPEGPWEWQGAEDDEYPGAVVASGADVLLCWEHWEPGDDAALQEFIAHARIDVPLLVCDNEDLVAGARRLLARIAELERQQGVRSVERLESAQKHLASLTAIHLEFQEILGMMRQLMGEEADDE